MRTRGNGYWRWKIGRFQVRSLTPWPSVRVDIMWMELSAGFYILIDPWNFGIHINIIGVDCASKLRLRLSWISIASLIEIPLPFVIICSTHENLCCSILFYYWFFMKFGFQPQRIDVSKISSQSSVHTWTVFKLIRLKTNKEFQKFYYVENGSTESFPNTSKAICDLGH